MSYEQPSEVPQPSESPLNLPALRIIRTGFRRTSSLGPLPWAPLVGRDGWLDLPRAQPVPKAFTVIGLVSDEFFGALLRPACSLPGYSHCFKRGHGQPHLVGVGARQP